MDSKPAAAIKYQPLSLKSTIATTVAAPSATTVPPVAGSNTISTLNQPIIAGAKPNNWIYLTVFALFFCCFWPALFCSIIAIVYSMQADQSWDMGHPAIAKSAAQNAKKWGIAAILTGVFTLVIFVSVEAILLYGGPYTLPRNYQHAYGVQSS